MSAYGYLLAAGVESTRTTGRPVLDSTQYSLIYKISIVEWLLCDYALLIAKMFEFCTFCEMNEEVLGAFELTKKGCRTQEEKEEEKEKEKQERKREKDRIEHKTFERPVCYNMHIRLVGCMRSLGYGTTCFKRNKSG